MLSSQKQLEKYCKHSFYKGRNKHGCVCVDVCVKMMLNTTQHLIWERALPRTWVANMDGFKITEGERSENKSKDQAETEEKIRHKLRGSYAETWLGSMLVIQISGLIRTNFGISFFLVFHWKQIYRSSRRCLNMCLTLSVSNPSDIVLLAIQKSHD